MILFVKIVRRQLERLELDGDVHVRPAVRVVAEASFSMARDDSIRAVVPLAF
jgi:hypothetical protein